MLLQSIRQIGNSERENYFHPKNLREKLPRHASASCIEADSAGNESKRAAPEKRDVAGNERVGRKPADARRSIHVLPKALAGERMYIPGLEEDAGGIEAGQPHAGDGGAGTGTGIVRDAGVAGRDLDHAHAESERGTPRS